ncbi:hypothetical protein [Xenorhabdus thailandensis]|uniref:hypothetical protein n=1 Tax=Xenorhabdus thailandensis TaxID=3136255 RepID=UPI0030F4AE34
MSNQSLMHLNWLKNALNVGCFPNSKRTPINPPYNVACQLAEIFDVPPCYFYIEDDGFAEKVLILYKHENAFEDEFITKLTTKTREYEKAIEDFKNAIETIQSINKI